MVKLKVLRNSVAYSCCTSKLSDIRGSPAVQDCLTADHVLVFAFLHVLVYPPELALDLSLLLIFALMTTSCLKNRYVWHQPFPP